MKIYTRAGIANLNNIEIKPYNNNPYANPNKFQFSKIDIREYFYDIYCFELLSDATYKFWVEHRDMDGIFDSEEIDLSDEDKNYIKTLHQNYMGSMLKNYIDIMKGNYTT
jgi:hypothetical protein